MEALKPIPFDSLGIPFAPLPSVSSEKAVCRVTILKASELHGRAEWYVKDKTGLLLMPDFCFLCVTFPDYTCILLSKPSWCSIERELSDGSTYRALFDLGIRKVVIPFSPVRAQLIGDKQNGAFKDPTKLQSCSTFRISSPLGVGDLLQEMNLTPSDINAVYLSHLHVSTLSALFA